MAEGAGAPSQLVAHLFREEAGKLLAALTRVLGLHNVELAEDLVQDTLCQALETWKYGALPDNPSAWLMRVARNRAIDVIRHERVRRRFAPELTHLLETEWTLAPTVAALFLEHEIRDDQLRLMFSCCPPQLGAGIQVALVLKLLCGFSVAEIASAFLTTEAAAEKQVARGKKVLKESRGLVDVSAPGQIARRMESVHRALYLLFNEGYHSSQPAASVRADLCHEAIRLGELLAAHPAGDAPRTRALVALMCLHAARLPARLDAAGDLVLLDAQDRGRWDRDLIARGFAHLDAASAGSEVSEYHLEAAIASLHAAAPSLPETDWRAVVALYDHLLALSPSPVVALNRAIALGQREGPEAGLAALDGIAGRERLADYPVHHAARAELLRRAGRRDEAAAALRLALQHARNPSERRLLESKLAACLRDTGGG